MASARSSGVVSLRFNQDSTLFSCCLKNGFRVYNVDPLVEMSNFTKEEVGEVYLCEMIFRTNWLLVVRREWPTKLMILDEKTRVFKGQILFGGPITALRARKDKVAVALLCSIHVMAIPELKRIAVLRTPLCSNPLCDIVTDTDAPRQILAAAAHKPGSVQILDLARVTNSMESGSPTIMSCHKGKLACLRLSRTGLRMATASERGTLIRVWNLYNKDLMYELRRGTDYAEIYSLSFNHQGTTIACMSGKGTLHIWNTNKSETQIVTTSVAPFVKSYCALTDNFSCVVVSQDATFQKFNFSNEGSCHKTSCEHFLTVGNDDDILE